MLGQTFYRVGRQYGPLTLSPSPCTMCLFFKRCCVARHKSVSDWPSVGSFVCTRQQVEDGQTEPTLQIPKERKTTTGRGPNDKAPS